MMQRQWIVGIGLLFMAAALWAQTLAPDQLPMYGGLEKTPEIRTARAALLQSIQKKGLSREQAARQAVQEGWTLWREGDIANAMVQFNQGWLLDPANGNAYHGFAIVTAMRGGASGEVERLFQRAVSQRHVDAEALVDYGRFLWKERQLQRSLLQLHKALEKSPHARNARSNMAFVYYLQGNYASACQWAIAARKNDDALEKGFLEDMCQRAAMHTAQPYNGYATIFWE